MKAFTRVHGKNDGFGGRFAHNSLISVRLCKSFTQIVHACSRVHAVHATGNGGRTPKGFLSGRVDCESKTARDAKALLARALSGANGIGPFVNLFRVR